MTVAKISEFGWMGGIVLQCTECPSQFQMAAGDPEAFENVVQKIVDHKHVIENGATGTINMTARATGPNTSIMQSGRDLHVSNHVAGHTGPLVQAGDIGGSVTIDGGPAKRPTHGVEHGYFW
jgi:hypothetical protein